MVDSLPGLLVLTESRSLGRDDRSDQRGDDRFARALRETQETESRRETRNLDRSEDRRDGRGAGVSQNTPGRTDTASPDSRNGDAFARSLDAPESRAENIAASESRGAASKNARSAEDTGAVRAAGEDSERADAVADNQGVRNETASDGEGDAQDGAAQTDAADAASSTNGSGATSDQNNDTADVDAAQTGLAILSQTADGDAAKDAQTEQIASAVDEDADDADGETGDLSAGSVDDVAGGAGDAGIDGTTGESASGAERDVSFSTEPAAAEASDDRAASTSADQLISEDDTIREGASADRAAADDDAAQAAAQDEEAALAADIGAGIAEDEQDEAAAAALHETAVASEGRTASDGAVDPVVAASANVNTGAADVAASSTPRNAAGPALALTTNAPSAPLPTASDGGRSIVVDGAPLDNARVQRGEVRLDASAAGQKGAFFETRDGEARAAAAIRALQLSAVAPNANAPAFAALTSAPPPAGDIFNAFIDGAAANAAPSAPATTVAAIGAAGSPALSAGAQASGSGSPAASQIAGHIADAARLNQNTLRVRLDPPELGRVNIAVKVTAGGNVEARIVVERADTFELLQQDGRHLLRGLANAGFDGDENKVDFVLDDGSGAFDPSDDAAAGARDGDVGAASNVATDDEFQESTIDGYGLERLALETGQFDFRA